MAGIEDAIAWTKSYAADDRFGYELGGRTMSIGTDCSGLAGWYCDRLMGKPFGTHAFSTRTMRKALYAEGWSVLTFCKPSLVRGDLVLVEKPDAIGHVVIWLGGNRILGAEGNWDKKRGDSSGTEICERSYYAYGWNYILRPPMSITHPGGTPAKAPEHTGVGGTYRVNVKWLNVRDKPSVKGSAVTHYTLGATVTLDDWFTVADGYVWGRYTGGSSGKKRYVAIGKNTGKAEADDFLVRV